MLRKYVRYLLNPAPPSDDGGGSEPTGMSGWMKSLGTLDTGGSPLAPSDAQATPDKPKEPDGKATLPNAAAGTADATTPAAAATDKDKPLDKKPADDGKAVAEKPAADKLVDEKGKDKDKDKDATEEEKWPRSSQDWEKFKNKRKAREESLRQEIASREATIKELQAKVETVSKVPEASPEVSAELETVKKLNQALTEKIMVLDVTQHPQFKSYFDNKVSAQVKLAQNIVGPEKADAVAKALALPNTEEYRDIKNQRIEEIIGDLNVLQQSRFGSVINALEAIDAEKSEEIAKASSHKAELTTKASDQAKKSAASRETMFNSVVASLKDKEKGMPMFQERDDNPAWNSDVAKRVETAKTLLFGDKVKPEAIVTAALHAASFPTLLEAYKTDLAERDASIEKLQAQVKALSAAQPAKGGEGGGKGGGSQADGGDPVVIKHGMTPMEASSAFMRGLWKEGQ